MYWAKETVAICEAGFYVAPSGKKVEIADSLEKAMAGTTLHSPETEPLPEAVGRLSSAAITVTNETTVSALARLARTAGDQHIGCLNFASAKNPGGGFLTGAQAQEEALARSSGLYQCLLQAPQYYERNRANRSTIYLDMLIYSPLVPFFRGDEGVLLEEPIFASVITAPAPNAGAVAQNEPVNLTRIEEVLKRRADLVLTVAQNHKIDDFVLGAWGCEVFRNDPGMVARIFADLLKASGKFANVFSQVIFAVYDRTPDVATYEAFEKTLNEIES